MAYPYDDEEQQKDPLVIEDTPRPSHNLIDQAALQEAPQTAPTPVVQVDAYARNTSPPADQKNPAAVLAQDDSAYTPAQIPEPVRLHPVSTDPFVEQQNLEREQQAAQRDQATAQTEENQRAAQVKRNLKSQGVEMETDLQTGEERPKIDDSGRTIFKPKIISPLEQREDGTYVSVHRDRFGNEQDVPLKPKLDKDTGERYVVSADGVSRTSLGIDEDYILRRDTNNLGKIASQARAELAAIGSQRKEIKQQIEDYGSRAAVIASKKVLTDQDRAELQRLRGARQSLVDQSDQLNTLHEEKSGIAADATNQYLQKRGLIAAKIKDSMGIGTTPPPADPNAPPSPGTTPSGPRTFSPPPALKPAIDAARAGQKPYAVGNDGTVQFSREKPLDSLNQAVKDGLIDPKYAAQHQADFAKVQKTFDDLEKSAGSYQAVKAALRGVGSGAAFLAGAAPGARIGALAGAAVPVLGETGISEAAGAALGGLVTGSAAAYGYNKLLKKAGDYNEAVKSLNDAAELHPVLNSAGEFVAFGASAPRALTNLYRLGVMGAREGGAAGAAKLVGEQLMGQATGALAFEGGLRPAFDLAKNAVADQLGIEHDKFQGPTYESLGQMVALGWLTGSSHIAFKDYSQADIASLLLRGKVRAVAGLKPTDSMSVPQVVEAMKKIGVDVDSQGAQSLVQPLTPLEAALHKDLATKVKKMEDAGDFEGATGAQFKEASQATIPQMGGKAKVISSSTIEAERTPREPGPPSEVAAQLHDALSTHREDLQRERDAAQQEIDDPSKPMEGKADQIARVKQLDEQIGSLPPAPPAQQTGAPDEQVNAAQRTDEPQPAAPGAGGTTDNRPVSDKTEADTEVQQPEEKSAKTDVRQRETSPEGAQPDNADERQGVLTPVPDLQKTEDAIAYGRSGTADRVELATKRHEALKAHAAALAAGDLQTATDQATKAQLYREALQEARKTPEVRRGHAAGIPNEEGRAFPLLEKADNPGFADPEHQAILKEAKQKGVVKIYRAVVKGQPIRDGDHVVLRRKDAEQYADRSDMTIVSQEVPVNDVAFVENPGAWPIRYEPRGGKFAKQRAAQAGTVDASAHEAATSPQNEKPTPSLAQHEADNAELGHDSISGMPISFENPAGSIRTNVDLSSINKVVHTGDTPEQRNFARQALRQHKEGDESGFLHSVRALKHFKAPIETKGEPWANKMIAHYGRFKGVTGADGDLLDAFVKEGTPRDYSGPVFVVNQYKPNGDFDEHKVVVGAENVSEALALYKAHYPKDWKMGNNIVRMTMPQFKVWARDSRGAFDKSKPVKQGNFSDANNQQKTAAVHVQKPSETGEGKGQERESVPSTTGERGGPVSDHAQTKAKRLLETEASQQSISRLVARGAFKILPADAPRQGGAFLTNADTGLVTVHMGQLAEKLDGIEGEQAKADWVADALEHELRHHVTVKAMTREEIADVGHNLSPDERAALTALYGDLKDDFWAGAEAIAIFGQAKTGRNVSAFHLFTEKAKGDAGFRALIQKWLDYARELARGLAGKMSAALRNAIERTQKVLDEIDAASKPERAPPKEKKPVTPQVPALTGMTPLGGKPKPEKPKPTSGASQELKDQAKKAFEGLFAPEPGEPWWKQEMRRRGLNPGRALNDIDLKNPSVREAIRLDPTLSDKQKTAVLRTGDVSALGRENISHLFAGEVIHLRKWIDSEGKARPASELNGTDTIAVNVKNGERSLDLDVDNPAEHFADFADGRVTWRDDGGMFWTFDPRTASLRESVEEPKGERATTALRPDDHGINLAAPEPNGQIALPKEKRAIFFDLADKMAAEGLTTPEKVAAFLEEIGGGRLRPYSQSLWSTMAAAGAVEHAVVDWAPIYSKLESANEPAVRSSDSDAGLSTGPEGANAGQSESAGEVSGNQLPAETAGLGARQPGSGGRGERDVAGVGQSGESLAATRADDAERVDSPVTGAGPGDSGGTSLTGPTGRGGTGSGGSERNYRIGPGAIAPSGNVAKLKANLGALKLLKQLQADNRPATPEEQAKLVQYTGWGQFKAAFDEIKAGRRGTYQEDPNWTQKWGKIYDQLKAIMTPEEWERAAESTLNAHYTAPEEIQAMWQLVKRLGFNGGRVLEPAIGTGNFFGLMPEDLMQHSKLFGMDMDSMAAGISQKLYPAADIKVARFEKAKIPNNYYDLMISNVPFHEVGPVDSRYPQLNLHNYFFARAFDVVKPGGLVVAITSNGTLDNQPDQRKYLADKADLVAAIRLPNTAFRENAGTEVTTDILVFRKPDGTPFKGETFLSTVQVGEDKGQPVIANEYFARHPEMAIGRHSLQGTMYRENSYALVPDKYKPLAESLREAIQKVPENIFSHGRNFYDQQQQDFGIVREGEKEGSVSFRDGKPLQVTGNEYKTPAWSQSGFSSRTRDPVKRVEMAKSFVGLRDQMKEILAEELNPAATDAGLEASRAKLRDLYDNHVKAFGQLEKGNLKFLEDDPEYYLVMGLEVVDKERKGDAFEKTIRRADIQTQRTLFPSTPPTHVGDVKDAALVSMQYRGKIDVPYVAELTGMQPEDAEQSIIDSGLGFKNPISGLLETRDAYLSSNVRQKLREAEAAAKDDPRYEKNVEQLKAIQPERIGFENISARAGSSWIPEPVYTSFAQRVLGKSAKVTYNKTLDRWSVSLSGKETGAAENKSIYGTERASGTDILGDVLNLRNPKIYDTVEEMNDAGKMSKKQVLNKAATDQAQAKALRFKQEFDTFMREDPDANKSIEDTYNEQFNSYVVPQFDGSHLVFPGMASVYKGKPMKLRSNQKDGIFRVTQTGGALLAHGVGAGKTITIIASAMEMRRLGLARKPLIVVDKPTTGQFAQTFRQVYPNANVLVATEDSFTAANRKRFMSRIATGNWDAVVMSNSQFDLMPNDPAVIQQYVQTSIDQLKEIASEVEGEEGKGTPKVRQIRTEIKRLENRLGKLLDRLGKRQDDTIYFEQLGVDALFVDEAHGYKKVPFVTKMDPVKGIDRQPSQKAIALHAKVQFVHKNNRFKNVITATGTPVTNTLAEAWNMTRLVNPKLLEEWGVDTFDKFVSTFAEVVNSTEINAANQWVSVERLSRFTNGPELVKMIRTAWDVRMGEDLKDLTLPSIKGGKPELVSLEVTPEQLQITSFLQSVYKQFQGLQAKQRREYSWIPIVTMSTGMAASVDPRLVNPSLPDNPNSVINKSVENVAAIYHETTPKRSTQIVFLDRYRPMNTEKIRRFAAGAEASINTDEEGWADKVFAQQANRGALEPADNAFSDSPLNLYDDLREKLVKAGIPREEIAIAAEHDSDAKRLKMQEDMQTGRIRVLIGSTAKIGQGINVSDKLYAAHHLDPPIQMTPAQYIQRNGRIIRDPNENTEVRMLNYGMKRTLAAGIWDRINTKAKFIIQILMGKGVGRDFEDPADEITMSIAEQVAELTGDRRVLQKVELESQVRALQAAREAHYNNVGSARRSLRETQQQLGNYDSQAIPNAEKDKALLERTFGPEGKNVEIKVGNKSFTDLKEYDATIKDLIETGQKKAEAHFADEANKKDWHLTFDIHQEINGLRAETRLVFTNPEKRMSYEDKIDVQTAFSSPNTRLIGTSRATTGTYIWLAAKKLWTERDERIADLTKASQNARDQIPKLEAEANKTFTQEKELETKSAELDKLTRELLDGDAPKEAGGGSLTEPPTLAAPEPAAGNPNHEVLRSAYAELPEIEKKVVSGKLQGKTDAELAKTLKLTETAVNTAYQIAIRKIERARQAAADIKSTLRKVVAEKPGQRTMGRPGLANPASGDLSRKLVDTVDEIRKQSGVPTRRKDTDVISEARARLTKNYANERSALLERAAKGLQLDDVETVMAKRIVAREALSAVRGGTNEKILEAAKLIDAYRMTGTQQARAMRQRFDNYLSPEERASEYIAESILTPDAGRRNRLSQLGEQIEDLEKQLEDAKNTNLDPMKLKEILDERERHLKERENIIANWSRKVEGIKKKLAALGIDLDNMSDEQITDALKDKTKATAAVRAVATAKTDNWDALYEYWINGLLSSPTTTVVKMLSDVAHATLDFGPQRWVEAAVNTTLSHFGLGSREAAQVGELPYIYKALFPALGRAFTNFLESWRTESPKFEGEFTGSEFHRPQAIAGMKGKIARTPTRLIMAADDAASSAIATLQVQSEAYRIAKAEGLTGDKLAARMLELTELNSGEPNDAWVAARDYSATIRFQNDLGPFGQWLQKGKKGVPGVRYAIPFVKTMSNIFKTALRKTPLGSARLLYKIGREGMVKMNWDGSGYSYERKNFVRDFSEQILAWAIVFGLLGLTRKRDEDDGLPLMTGSNAYTPGNRGQRDLAMRTAPPTSIKIGDRWYNYSRIEPLGVMLTTTVDLINRARGVEQGGDVTQAMGELLNQALSQIKDKTFARGVSDILNAIQDGEHATEWAGNFATTWEPFSSLVKASARNSDDTIREQKVWGREEWTQSMIDSLKYRALPIAGDVMQPKVDLWGQEIKRDQGASPATDWLYRMTVPVGTIKAEKPQAIDRLILNWNNAHPEEIFAPTPPPPVWTKKIDGKDQHIYMTRDEYRQFLTISGRGALGRIEIESFDYNNPTKANIEAISKALEKSRKAARDQLWEQRVMQVR